MIEGAWTPLIKPPVWSRLLAGSFAILLVILNSVEISILRKRKRKKAYEKLLLSMSIADLLIGVLGITSGTVGAFAKRISIPHIDIIAWSAWSIAVLFGILASMFHLISISVDRLLATAIPLRHRIYLTGRKVALLISLCWGIPFIITTAFIIDKHLQELNPKEAFEHMFHSSTQFVAGCVIIADVVFLISYFAIIWIIFRHTKKSSETTKDKSRQHKRVLCLCMCVVFAFVLSSTPFVVMYLIRWKAPNWSKSFALGVFALNSTFNPVIFLAQNYFIKKRARKQTLKFQNSTLNIKLKVTGRFNGKDGMDSSRETPVKDDSIQTSYFINHFGNHGNYCKSIF